MSMASIRRSMAKAKERKVQDKKLQDEAIKANKALTATKVAQAVSTVVEEYGSSTAGKGQLNKNEVGLADFNDKQMLAVRLAELGKSFCLIGAAGSGKTTTTRGVVQALEDNNAIGILDSSTEKVLKEGAPSVAILSYTNQAVRNIKEALPAKYKEHCSTIHKLLEYQPVVDEVEELDDEGQWTGNYRKSMHYEPTYGIEPDSQWGGGAKLPHLSVVIVEEAGSVPVSLWETLLSALTNPEGTLFIMLGDLNQLPPVFGDGILGYKLLELPVVELTEVYRNVGLVTQFAHRILEGKPIPCKELASSWNKSDASGTLKFNPFKAKTDPKIAAPTLGRHFKNLVISGKFDYEHDVLLVPFNKQVGTIGLNKWIASGIDVLHDREVWEVEASHIKTYWAIGDRVLHNKMSCKIIDIELSDPYMPRQPLLPSKHLTRWGRPLKEYEHSLERKALESKKYETKEEIEQALEEALDNSEGASRSATHRITLELLDDSLIDQNGIRPTVEITSAGAVNAMMLTYAMSIHKSQGSEWRKVWLILHHSHALMFKRELLYTACTRARQDLEVFYSGQATTHKIGGSPFHMGIMKQEIEGKTLETKLKYFKDKIRAQIISESIKRGHGVPADNIFPTIVHDESDLVTIDNRELQPA